MFFSFSISNESTLKQYDQAKQKQLNRCGSVSMWKWKNKCVANLMTHFHLIRVLFFDFSVRFSNITKWWIKLVSRLDAPDQNCCFCRCVDEIRLSSNLNLCSSNTVNRRKWERNKRKKIWQVLCQRFQSSTHIYILHHVSRKFDRIKTISPQSIKQIVFLREKKINLQDTKNKIFKYFKDSFFFSLLNE